MTVSAVFIDDIDDFNVPAPLATAPNMAAPHMQLGNNYLFLEPKDFNAAEEHFQAAVDLAPDEPQPYDLLGDVHRAQGKLELAAMDYGKAAELAPDQGSPLQQRGPAGRSPDKPDPLRPHPDHRSGS